MKILIVHRKNGKVKIEIPDDANIKEVLEENEIKTYLKYEIKDGNR